jgi:hypothetical protein
MHSPGHAVAVKPQPEALFKFGAELAAEVLPIFLNSFRPNFFDRKKRTDLTSKKK